MTRRDRARHPSSLPARGRQRDVVRFDLASYEVVRTNAEAIYQRLADGSMPSDSRWTPEEVERFRAWIDTGSPP